MAGLAARNAVSSLVFAFVARRDAFFTIPCTRPAGSSFYKLHQKVLPVRHDQISFVFSCCTLQVPAFHRIGSDVMSPAHFFSQGKLK